MMTSLYIVLLLLLRPILCVEIDNGILGEPMIDCEDTMLSMTFTTENPFTGRVYVKGLHDDDRCARSFGSNTDQNMFSVIFSQGDCGMKRDRHLEGGDEGIMHSLIVVISFHGTFVTKADRAFRLMCFFRNTKRVTNLLDMSMIGTTDLLDTGSMPECSYTMRQGSQTGDLVRYGKIGDKIFHVWECESDNIGFLVHSCYVDDGRGNKFDLYDEEGCAIDPIIQTDIIYNDDSNLAWVETHGYKFSDTSVLDYQCILELCQKSRGDECAKLTPPTCGGAKRRTFRSVTVRRRPAHTRDDYNDNELDVSSRLNILDTFDAASQEDERPLNNFLQGLNQAVRPAGIYLTTEDNPARMCLSTPAYGALISIVMLLFCTSITAAILLVCRRKHLFADAKKDNRVAPARLAWWEQYLRQ